MLTKAGRWVASVKNDRVKPRDLSPDGQPVVSDPEPKSPISPPSLREGLPPFDIVTIKDFLRYKASISDGRIDEGLERTTTDSLNAFAEWFFAGFARVTGNPIPTEDRQEAYDVSTYKPRHREPLLLSDHGISGCGTR